MHCPEREDEISVFFGLEVMKVEGEKGTCHIANWT
jgi:hypothetical protein